MNDEPRFLVSFDCEAEYEYNGEKYRVRLGANRSITRSDYFPMVVKCIGTVMFRDSSKFHEFPSEEVVKVLSESTAMGAPLVAGKWAEDFSDVLYNGEKPEITEDQDQYTVWSKPYRERWDKWWSERNAA